MHRYRVELRDNYGKTKAIHLVAENHTKAKLEAELLYGLLVLSTEFLE